MDNIWQVALAIVGSFGGAGAIIWACSRWVANLTAESIIRKTEFEFAKKLEDFKSKLDNKTYISKVRFDLEIEIYKELSAATLEMVMENCNLFPFGLTYSPQDKDTRLQYYQDNYKKASDTYNIAGNAIYKNAPFIPKDMWQAFDDIRKSCGIQINMYRWCGDLANEQRSPNEPFNKTRAENSDKCFQRTQDIYNDMKSLMDKLREHIASLDVLEKN